VGTGFDFSCALLNNKKVACWGSEANGRLCNGSTTGQENTPVLTSVTSAVQISVGRTHACALLENKTIQCWGEGNANARMGDGSSSSDNSAPRTVSGISTAVQVVAGYAHTCALLADGTIKCWGKNESSQLGDHGTTTADTPVSVTDVTGDATALSLGKTFTCVTFANGTVKCWGKGSSGELGNDSTADSVSPVAVYGLDNNANQ
jgi:alpha-tubulin suppressor-like RCC1 family protein